MNKVFVLQLLSELKQVHRSDMATTSSDTGRVIDIKWQLPRFSGINATRPHHQSRAVASVSILYCGH